MKILVADGHVPTLGRLESLLSASGFLTACTTSGRAALEASEDAEFDIAVLAVDLPDRSGIEICQRMKARVDHFLPVILLLSEDSTEARVVTLDGGADDLLTRPIDERELLARIKALLRIKMLHDEVRHLASLREQIVYTVSHDFRTPVVGIRGAVQNLLNGLVGKISTEQAEYLKLVDDATNRLSEMTDQMCRTARRVRGNGRVRREAVNLRKAAETAAAGLRPEIVKRQIRLEIVNEKELPAAWGDPVALTRVIANLLDNAVKHSPDEGRIRVEIEAEHTHLVIKVTDEGPGIARSDFERIFYRFEQVGDPEHTKDKGTGLGLAICKEIVEAHSGRIWVESERGVGARFFVKIPATAPVRGVA